MKKFRHILSLFAEDVILPDNIESNLLHNSIENFSKDGSDRICATAAFINLGLHVFIRKYVHKTSLFYLQVEDLSETAIVSTCTGRSSGERCGQRQTSAIASAATGSARVNVQKCSRFQSRLRSLKYLRYK